MLSVETTGSIDQHLLAASMMSVAVEEPCPLLLDSFAVQHCALHGPFQDPALPFRARS